MLLSFHKTSGMRCRVRPSGKSSYNCRAFSLLVFSLFILGLSAPSQAIVYVDKDRPGGNGTSWAQAYRTLEDANNNTPSGQEFWIAEGTYTPGSPLVLTKNHSFYGGFAGTETARNQRDINGHPTVIDGRNILKHVFYSTHLTTSVRFDGLTIKRGNANAASGEDSTGGGILVNKGAVVIANCSFQNNSAYHMGGAVHLVNCPSVLITNSEITNSTVSNPMGGGAGVSILKNNDGTNPLATVEKSVFTNNTGGNVGGGLYSYYYPMLVRECTFVDNSSGHGGGILYDYKLPGSDKIERCYFFNNRSTSNGGAVGTWARSIEIENSVFGSNTSSAGGGAVNLNSGLGNPTDYNNTFSGTFRNCTFYNNRATSYGGAVQNIGGHPMYIYNSIFWGNQGAPLYQDGATRSTDDFASHHSSIGSPTITMRYTDMESFGGADTPAHVSQVGCFSANPVLVDPDGPDNITGTSDDNLSIQYSSPCIDRADGNNATALDIEFRPRTDYGPTPNLGIGTPDYGDIGAYEGPSTGSPPVEPPPERDGVSIVGPILKPLLLSPKFSEEFEGTWPPPGWRVDDHAGTGLTWERSDTVVSPGEDNLCSNGSGYAAVADSDELDASAVGMNTSLVSPPITLPGSTVYLGYASHFQDYFGAGVIWLDISTNNGASWINLRYQSTDDPPGGLGRDVGGTWEVENLTAYKGKTVLLRWRYSDNGAWAWYWHIDTVKVSETVPTP